MKQAIKKGAGVPVKKKGLAAWKEKAGLSGNNLETTSSNANKQQEFLIMPKAFVDIAKIPGIPVAAVSGIWGASNVGKSTLVNHAIVSAQRQGYIPVIIDTENNFSFQYAMNMGFEATPVYGDVEVEKVDEETGEVLITKENKIVNWDGNFIYYNNNILCDRFGDIDYSQGKKVSKKRKVAVIEDIATCINELLDLQEEGEIDQGFVFVIDAIGSIGSFKEYNSGKIANAMWAAAAISQAFNNIVNNRIPSSKKISSKYSNTLLYVNKIWLDNMSNPMPGSPATVRPKGGLSLLYSSRYVGQLGGDQTAGIKRLKAQYKGVEYNIGIQTKYKVVKNHLDAPYDKSGTGALIATDLGFIGLDELENYKKTHMKEILKRLNEQLEVKEDIKEEDISFIEEDIDEEIENQD